MYNRTDQDNDISLYSLAEIRAMINILESNSKSYVPFSLKELNEEIAKRLS